YIPLITARSSYWYIKAKPGLSGISKDQVAKRIIEAGRVLPVKGLEGYPNMFSKARPGSIPKIDKWRGLVGKVYAVDSRKRSQYIGVDLLPGQAIRVVPNSKERWTVGGWGGTYIGTGYTYRGDTWQEGMILVKVGQGSWVNPKEAITGEGKVYVTCWRGGSSSNSGEIQVKIVKMQ
ncbi:MAG: hypothetical protein HRU15_11775, partial [Planctomycetes bacterium]|nr:hypothetical protein [Planctomycetota bacterium]